MSKRVTITEKNPPKQEVKIYPKLYTKWGKEYFSWLVRWKEDGKYREKRFQNKDKAEAFRAAKNIEFLNAGAKQQLTLSTLNDEQTRAAERAFKVLGETYTMDEAIEFFLKHHRPPEFTITIMDG